MLFQRITKGRTCPVCKSAAVYRVKRSGLPIKVVCKLLNLRPHWCPECDTFFLGPRRSKDLRIPGPLGSTNQPQGDSQPQAGSLPH
jgi:hypothetical protein